MLNEIKEVTIAVDMREERSGIPSRLQAMPGVTLNVVDLLCGDYSVADGRIGIERKTNTDFVISILDGRLVEQVARMTTEYETAIILIEGDIYATRSTIDPTALDGALSWLSLLSDIKVLHTPDTTRTAERIFRMALHLEHGLGYTVPLRSNKPKDMSIAARFVLEGLPGCGPETARKLLAHFGSVSAVLAASESQWRQVPGVGPKMAERMRAVIEYSIQSKR